ncbi:Platelet-activating factor acetylhydrolase, isoform II [Sinosporangium album]|uniref:Platelet-activating factor acetylhydrolase, isoform II n=1 Tax=Sinosporangium album TaxID=504805 RepID=A0A1G8J9M0_9ACTN|nr:prolyl oligopeptidase family serine peptidase [Sinosporangium album]SDI27935.1 Platelet-activating factor acetylhydrolase, isoform II [Sinosporangium album]
MGHVTEPVDAGRPYGGAGASAYTVRWGTSQSTRGRILRGGVVAAGLLAFMATTSAASAQSVPALSASVPASAGLSQTLSSTLYLPKPTGSHPVGTTSLYLKDTSRSDPWVPSVKARELMASLWYPAKSPGRKRAPYMTPKESELLLKSGGITSVPADTLSKTRTNAFTDAHPAGRRHGLPFIVLSPGHTKPRTELTALAEDLASRGYVVVAIDHTYENVAATFPDGRVTTCVTCEINKNPAWWEKLAKSRAADVSFVLDQLIGSHSKWKHARLIDPSRIAMAGHSAGGASTIATMLKDSRVRAGINMDGTTDLRIPDSGLSRPFLFLGKPATYTPGKGEAAATWERDWKQLNGWKRWLLVTGAEHTSFTDLGVLADQIGIDVGADIPGVRAMDITRKYVAAFFDLHLRKQPQPLLDKPSTRYPEVKHCSVETKTCQ